MESKTVAQWACDKRKEKNMKQKDVLAITGLSLGYYSKIESGQIRPAYETWAIIARVLEPDVSESEIMEVYKDSDPENKIKGASEEKLIRAFRKGDITTCVKIIERREAELRKSEPEVIDITQPEG